MFTFGIVRMYMHVSVFMYENAGTQEPQSVEIEDNHRCPSSPYTMFVTVSLLFSPS